MAFLLLILGVFAAGHCEVALAGGAKADLIFSLSDQHGAPLDQSKENFDCSDKIYAVTNLHGFDKGKHAIEFRWSEPNGETRERTQYDFFVREEPNVKLWAWLELTRGQGAAMFQWLNPAAGLEEFIGQWSVDLLVDGEKVASNRFEVTC